MKKEFAVNYQKHWDDDGTTFSQTINITRDTLEKIKLLQQSELCMPKYHKTCIAGDNHYRWTFLKKHLERKGDIVFMNLTQRDFFNRYLKLKLKDRNTCFCVIK